MCIKSRFVRGVRDQSGNLWSSSFGTVQRRSTKVPRVRLRVQSFVMTRTIVRAYANDGEVRPYTLRSAGSHPKSRRLFPREQAAVIRKSVARVDVRVFFTGAAHLGHNRNSFYSRMVSLNRSSNHCFCSAIVISELSSRSASSAFLSGLTSRWESM